MKLHTLFIVLLSASIFTLNGCGGGSGSDSSPTSTPTPTPTQTPGPTAKPTIIEVSITDDYQVEDLGTASNLTAKVSLGNTPKDLYLVLSNNADNPTDTAITHNAKIIKKAQSKIITPHIAKKAIHHRPQYVEDFLSNMNNYLSKSNSNAYKSSKITQLKKPKDISGQSQTFYLDTNTQQTTTATARKIISDITTNFGTKTLNIWVSDDSFDSGSGCSKSKCVTQSMVDNLAKTFLTTGTDNDIYNWVTNIFGQEWGSDAKAKYDNLIHEDNEITILLTDIDDDDNANSGVIGFFWAKDNFDQSTISGSNERVMFYADAVMFANTDKGDFWQKEMYSTLGHEFQHMIHFYQKTILLLSEDSESTDTWIDEMLSESTEDLIATKIKHIGSRGVEYTDGTAGSTGNTSGRYPLFNTNNTLSLTSWDNYLEDYSKVNAFGAYLIRNYGGAKLLHDIMYNPYIDEQAVVDAVNKSADGSGKIFDDLLNEWGVTVLLSDHSDLSNIPYYNTGDFTYSTHNTITYDMGSVNFFNYNPLPTIHTTEGTIEAKGNYYYKVGDNLTGDITINLGLNGKTQVTLIAK